MRIYQLSRLRKYITKDVANLIYKQTILPVVEYADQMVGSGPKDKAVRLQTLQDRAIRIIDNNEHRELNKLALSAYYRITPLNERRAEHLCVVMHRLSKNDHLLDISRPEIHLRNHNKVKLEPTIGSMKST